MRSHDKFNSQSDASCVFTEKLGGVNPIIKLNDDCFIKRARHFTIHILALCLTQDVFWLERYSRPRGKTCMIECVECDALVQ